MNKASRILARRVGALIGGFALAAGPAVATTPLGPVAGGALFAFGPMALLIAFGAGAAGRIASPATLVRTLMLFSAAVLCVALTGSHDAARRGAALFAAGAGLVFLGALAIASRAVMMDEANS